MRALAIMFHRVCLLLILCLSTMLLLLGGAQAQCSARDVMRHHPEFVATSSGIAPPQIESAAGTPVWKSIQIGTFVTKQALHQAFDDADCGIDDMADEILVAPGFSLSGTALKLDLVAISVSELGVTSKHATLEDIYAEAQKRGFVLAAPEVGPQLRLQYFDQPIGEFLQVAMSPIRMRSNASGIFVVANGGAGLVLLGEAISAGSKFDPSSRFVFVRPIDIAGAHQ